MQSLPNLTHMWGCVKAHPDIRNPILFAMSTSNLSSTFLIAPWATDSRTWTMCFIKGRRLLRRRSFIGSRICFLLELGRSLCSSALWGLTAIASLKYTTTWKLFKCITYLFGKVAELANVECPAPDPIRERRLIHKQTNKGTQADPQTGQQANESYAANEENRSKMLMVFCI